MQKKNVFRLLALVMTLVMALAIAVPALAATEGEEAAPVEAEAEELETVVEEPAAEEELIFSDAWTKYYACPAYAKKGDKDPAKVFYYFTKLKLIELDGDWAKVSYSTWYNNMDGAGNQELWYTVYVRAAHITNEMPLFERHYSIYVAR